MRVKWLSNTNQGLPLCCSSFLACQLFILSLSTPQSVETGQTTCVVTLCNHAQGRNNRNTFFLLLFLSRSKVFPNFKAIINKKKCLAQCRYGLYLKLREESPYHELVVFQTKLQFYKSRELVGMAVYFTIVYIIEKPETL